MATRVTIVGTFPIGASELIGVDQAALSMIAEANAALDRQGAEEERQRQQAIADAERAKVRARGTRTARAARRFGHALRMFGRSR
jgi:hypothetical protein